MEQIGVLMQLDGTLQLPDGKLIAVVFEVDTAQFGTSFAIAGFADVIARAIEVLGSKERALAWLRSPVPGLGDKRPLDVIDTAEGRREVEDILGRIEHGVFG
jgi:putative toxin-antitoxin system antitoxin component (TIGR02293 family)